MRTLAFIVSIILILLTWNAFHTYKCEVQGFDKKNLGTILGTILGLATEGCCWYWAFKFLNLF